MSRSKRRGDNTAPALFPFLAVLLCTIGALVLILVITVANSHASARKEAEESIADIEDTTEMMEVVSVELEAQREDLKSRVERRRRELADIENHISRLTTSLDELTSKIQRIHADTSQTNADHSRKVNEVAALQKEIDKKKRELIDEIEKQKKRKPAFAVIPYGGSNGTTRRPVYLECTKEGVVVQPEGLLISLNDLRPPFGPGNPLDAALRVLRQTYQQKDTTFGITQPPYPLLIVRPDGIQTYALAREAMSGWDDQFGYELVDNEMELKFPLSPAGLKEQLISTVDLAKRRQQALIAAMPRRVVAQDGNDDWGDIDASNSTGKSASSGSGNSSGFSGENGLQQNWQLVQGMANSQVSGAIQKNGLESAQATSGKPGEPIKPTQPSMQVRPTPKNAFGGTGTPMQGQYSVAEGGRATTQMVFQQSGVGQGAKSNGQNNQGQVELENSSAAGDNNLRNQGANDLGSKAELGGAQGDSNSSASNSESSEVGTSQSGSNATNGSTASNGGSSKDGIAGSNAPAPQGYNQFSSGSTTGGGASSLSGSASQSQASADPAATPNLSLTMNQKADAQPSKAKHVRPEGDLKPISVSAGHGWAASRAEGKATPVSRPVNIIALKDKWLLRSDVDPNVFEANITMVDGPQQAGNQLAVAIRKRVDSWGLSVPGGFWSPTLTIEAASDAQQSVARLERLLEGSGVDIKVVPLTLPNRR